MKKIISSLAALIAVLGMSTAMAQAPSVYFDGERMTFDVEPYIADERTMVPFRAIFEAAGADVAWDSETQTVVAVKTDADDATIIALQIGREEAFVNSDKVTLDKAAEIVNDRTFVPLRFVMESLGADVSWDQESYSVTITTN